ncbi:YebC/PmpR family DNA-binding transcriptional regulator [Candidatus Microgenomates bacterium]|nr:YebC/PmpR family DNA-binding transcriptional regulator [Candidatus Microgenomates bacterium]
MSGHSKWSKIKHQKGATDAVKGKVFTKILRAIYIAVKESGNADPESNFKLRLAIEKAREANVPKENIERALEKAKGSAEGTNIEEVVYEAFGPGGVGIIILAATENKMRTVAEVKNILDRGGGSLAAMGSVIHFFKYCGSISVAKNGKTYDQIMEEAINIGAEDLEDSGEFVEIYTQPKDLHKLKEALQKTNFTVTHSELVYRPITLVPVEDLGKAKKTLSLLSSLEEIEDVQKVFANFDIPDSYLK